MGPQGPKGATGPQGATGPKGDPGISQVVVVSKPYWQQIGTTDTTVAWTGPLSGEYLINAKLVYANGLNPNNVNIISCDLLYEEVAVMDEAQATVNNAASRATLSLTGTLPTGGSADLVCHTAVDNVSLVRNVVITATKVGEIVNVDN